jgi:hypothetical protein
MEAVMAELVSSVGLLVILPSSARTDRLFLE